MINQLYYFPDKPSRTQWEQLTIDELVGLAKRKRSIKSPFKKSLIDYMMKIGLR